MIIYNNILLLGYRNVNKLRVPNKRMVKCKKCQSENITKRGQRKTQNRGLIQRYFCKSCNKRFVLDDGFYKKKTSKFFSFLQEGFIKASL